MTEELKPIDVSKYEVTETGQVLKVPKKEMTVIDKARQHGHNMEVEFSGNKEAFNIGYKSFLAGYDKAKSEANKLQDQLTKAKVALQNVIDYLGQFCSDYPDCVIEAEQFLQEVEK